MSSCVEIARKVASGEASALGVVEVSIGAARHVNPTINAFIDIFDDRARAIAARVDKRVRAGENLPLAGVPIAIKDNIATGPDTLSPGDTLGVGGRTTCASRFLERYESPFNATVVRRLLNAGAVPIAKTNLDEFAMGSSGEHSAFGPTLNPWDTSRVPGGSSSGSAACVSAGVCPVALGSDTGGSIRQPASLCGVVGVKPTYGRVSRYGLVAFASSLDQIGVLAGSVADAGLVLQAISGHDPLDSTSAQAATIRWDAKEARVRLRVGVPKQAHAGATSPGTKLAMDRTLAALRTINADVVEVDLPMTEYGIAAYYVVAAAEASSNLARFDGVRYGRRASPAPGEGLAELYTRSRSEGFGEEVKRRILLGTFVLSSGYYDAYYATALRARRRVADDYAAAFRSCDVIVMPASAGPAFKLGAKAADPLAMYLEDVYTVGVNLAGLPAITLPACLVRDDGADLPIGVQVIAPAFEEERMLGAAAALERAIGFAARPPLTIQ